jgi:hypothetical protein
MPTRRRFLLAGSGIAVALGVGVAGFAPTFAESQIVSHVRRRLSFLKLEEAGLHAFAQDQVSALLAKRPTWNRWKYHFLSIFTHSFTKYDRSDDHRSRIERTTDSFSQTYLLSSNFFINGADPTQPVEYVSLYDPLRPCGNPFARPPLPAGSAPPA